MTKAAEKKLLAAGVISRQRQAEYQLAMLNATYREKLAGLTAKQIEDAKLYLNAMPFEPAWTNVAWCLKVGTPLTADNLTAWREFLTANNIRHNMRFELAS